MSGRSARADGARAEQERKPSWTFEYGLGRSHACLQQRERRRSGWHGDAEGRRQRGVDPEGTAPLTKPCTPWSISARPPARPWTTKITEIPFKYHPSQRPHRLSFRLSDISTIRRSSSLVNAAASQNAFGRDQSFPIQACRLVGAHAREAANRDNGHQNLREATGNGLNLSANCPPKGYMIPVCKNR